ncbi:MAG: Flp pilus assembly protein CpaB [Spirochaetaceae bacterium]|nr:Flp pilus assembly protein CpaB [Spirochaetaceae bacterium]
MGRRTLLLLAALVVAALGTTGVFLYVNGISQRAEADYALVEILVATAPIEAGTTAQGAQDLGALELRPFLRKSLAGLPALSDISGVAEKVAVAPIAAGEPILETQFGNSGASSTLPIPDGKLAVSVQLGDPARVAGFVGAGSEVAIFMSTASANRAGDTTRLLLPKVSVIAAGSTTVVAADDAGGTGEAIPKTLLTLALDQREAQKVVYATQNGQLYLALLSGDAELSTTDPGVTAENLFD